MSNNERGVGSRGETTAIDRTEGGKQRGKSTEGREPRVEHRGLRKVGENSIAGTSGSRGQKL
jgi:hypothetical protein